MKNIMLFGLYLLLQQSLFAQAGTLDSTFGMDGRVITVVGTDDNAAQSLTIQPDGKILVTGSYYVSGDYNYDFAVLRYLSNGALDNNFGTNGIITTNIGVNDNSRCIALQPDGKIVAAGFTGLGSNDDFDFAVARYLPNGAIDSSFGSDGKLITSIGTDRDFLNGIAIQTDGKIIVAGNSRNVVDNNDDVVLVRYAPNGSLDNIFGINGRVITSIGTSYADAYSLALQSDGKILVAGQTKIGTQASIFVARYNPNGTLDNSFNGDGIQTTAIGSGSAGASAIALQPDGKIVIVGLSVGTITVTDICVVRYKTDGSLDNSFGTGGIVTTDFGTNTYDYAEAVCVQPDGKIVIAGSSLSSFTQPDDYFFIIRYNSDGTPDNGFGTGSKMAPDMGTSTLSFVREAVLQSDGKIVVAGGVENGTKSAIFVARCLAGPSVGVIDANAIFSAPLIYPNPISSGILTLGYTLPTASPVHIELMDSEGKSIYTLFNGERAFGENQESLQLPEGLPDGFYLVNIQTKLGNSLVRINKLNR